ncbi:aminodeoxychorismate synthase component I [Natronospira bacteriovora]|uniref:Aminodeoxychorismate synthase component I n=1 Tax=Natronospira bacteriovora TaxID=3069753 RepID=A0ABU0W5I8_9GAMM|nr:aminodeoxychorismate synthase component I [Natronospira sp. AB-CW4]MDQ2069256.1 aminodeoxychorismate synthase component I [Natronospira sp. AB-CW4]
MKVADFQTRRLSTLPDLLGMHEAHPGRYPFLLESAAHGTAQGRYSLLFAFPGDRIELNADELARGQRDFFTRLDQAWVRERRASAGSQLPFTGGWFFYLSYEAAAVVEPGLDLPLGVDSPVAWAVRTPAAVIIDHVESCAWLVAEDDQPGLIDTMAADCASSLTRPLPTTLLAEPLREDDPAQYCRIVERTREYIRDGDVFQANLSRLWQSRLAEGCSPTDVYRQLRQTNPGPFAGLARYGEQAIISSSPERLVSVRNGRVDTRPIAGTRPRGRPGEEDEQLRAELIGHPKERAEHIMLIDLERNDLGRICRPGSVEVSELMVLESYAHVHHIVSNVRGQLREAVTPGEVLRAVFPGGTITGCPKVRCMEIIAELEGRPRGAYTGSLGYLNRDGDMDSSILIRTMETHGDHLRLLAGAGIVADSIPERELDETRAKARGMVLAVAPEQLEDAVS